MQHQLPKRLLKIVQVFLLTSETMVIKMHVINKDTRRASPCRYVHCKLDKAGAEATPNGNLVK